MDVYKIFFIGLQELFYMLNSNQIFRTYETLTALKIIFMSELGSTTGMFLVWF